MVQIEQNHILTVIDAIKKAREYTWDATYRTEGDMDKDAILESLQNASDVLLWITAGIKLGTL